MLAARRRERPGRPAPVRLRAALCLLLALLPCTPEAATTLRIEGIEGPLQKNVEAYIGPREETDRMSWRALGTHIQAQAREALQAMGHYHPQITVTREGNGGSDSIAVVRIDAGEPVRLRRVDIGFNGEHPELAEIIEREAPRPGDTLNHGVYESFKTRLLQQALQRGYFAATWRVQQVRVDIDARVADIELQMDPGPRHKFGALTINGSGIADDLMRRYPRFREDDWYNAAQIAELHRDLVRTGWFESVQLRAEPEDARELVVPVSITYALRKKNRIGIGVGASTDLGPRAQLQWEKPWLNENGHSLNTYAEVSDVRSQVEASYVVPLTDPVNAQMAYTYGLQFEDLNDHEYWLTTAGIEHRKRLRSQWRVIRSLELHQETDEFATTSSRTTMLLPGVTFTRTDAEGSPLVTRGWRFRAEISGAADALGSDVDLLRGTVDFKAIQALTGRLRAQVRGGAGTLWTPQILDIPVSQRFFAGGDQSVRGYDYQSISPLNAGGERIGGSNLLSGSVEFDVRFAERWLLAVFVDEGSAWADGETPDFFNGAGAGIRWLSPIGPLRLDFAWGTSLAKDSFNVHFYMGPEL
jgi:translocation and assembly module TamA